MFPVIEKWHITGNGGLFTSTDCRMLTIVNIAVKKGKNLTVSGRGGT
jgi:hypothetical protein